MKVFVVSAMLFAATLAAPTVSDINQVQSADGTFTHMAKLLGHCAESGDMTTCLAIKGITALNRAARSQNIEIFPGVSFARDPTAESRVGKSMSENEIASTLPADSTEKGGRLLDLAMDSAANFMKSHSLQVKLPTESPQEFARAISEGRGKIKKIAGPLVLAIGAKLVALIPIFLGGLVLLATKALVVAKIAFVLAALLGIQKLGGGGSGFSLLGKVANAGQGLGYNAAQNNGWSSGNGQTWSSGSSSSYPYARSYDDAQEMAYSAQAPATQ